MGSHVPISSGHLIDQKSLFGTLDDPHYKLTLYSLSKSQRT